MCLKTKESKPFTATEDIIVFKVLANWRFGRALKIPETMVVKYPVPDDGILKAEGVTHIQYSEEEEMYFVAGGMIHAYTDLKLVKRDISYGTIHNSYGAYKATIPKGTLYFKGIQGDICSEVLHIDLSRYFHKRSTEKEINLIMGFCFTSFY